MRLSSINTNIYKVYILIAFLVLILTAFTGCGKENTTKIINETIETESEIETNKVTEDKLSNENTKESNVILYYEFNDDINYDDESYKDRYELSVRNDYRIFTISKATNDKYKDGGSSATTFTVLLEPNEYDMVIFNTQEDTTGDCGRTYKTMLSISEKDMLQIQKLFNTDGKEALYNIVYDYYWGDTDKILKSKGLGSDYLSDNFNSIDEEINWYLNNTDWNTTKNADIDKYSGDYFKNEEN